MTIRYTTAVKNARMVATAAKIDAGSGNAKLIVYTGTAPASNGAVTYQEKLAEFTLQKPATSISFGVMTALIDGRATVLKDGRIGWVRLVDGDGVAVADYDVGLAGSGADLILATLDVNKDSALELSGAELEV